MACQQGHVTFRHPELPGQKFDQSGVGPAVYGWCGDPNTQAIVMHPGDFILFAAGHNPDIEDQL